MSTDCSPIYFTMAFFSPIISFLKFVVFYLFIYREKPWYTITDIVHDFLQASVMALLTISAHRYMRVCHVTLHKKVLNLSTAVVCSAVCWFIALVIAFLPVTHLVGSYSVEEGTNVCSVTSQKPSDDYLMGMGFWILVEVPLIVGNLNWAIYQHWRTSRPAVDKSVQMTGRGVSQTSGYMVGPFENKTNSRLSCGDETEEEREVTDSLDDCRHQVDVRCDQHLNVPPSVQSLAVVHLSPALMRRSRLKQVPVTQADLCHRGKREKLFLASLLVPLLLASFTFGGFAVIVVGRILADSFSKEGAIALRLVLVLNSSLNWLPYGLMNRRLRRDLGNRLRCTRVSR